MSNQQSSGSNSNNMSFGNQSIRFEDINEEYIAQLLSGYWPQPQNAPWGTSQNMDIPVPFSQTTTNASTSSHQPSRDTSTLPAPPAIVPSQGYHQFTFDELMRQIDRERELALVPQPSDAAIFSTQITSLQRTQQAQRYVILSANGVISSQNLPISSLSEVPGSSSQLPGFQGHPTKTTGPNTFLSTTMPDITVLTDKNLAAPATQTSTTASRRGSVSAQVDILK